MRSGFAKAVLVFGGVWAFLIPSSPDVLNAQSTVSCCMPMAASGNLRISLDTDSSDFDAPFLQEQIAVNFVDTPLADVAEFLSSEHEFPILLDVVAIEEAGLLVDEPINFVAGRIRVDQALDLILAEFDLTWLIDDGILHVTTVETANQKLLNRSFDLEPFRVAGISPSTLLEIVMRMTDAYWEEADGFGGRISIVGDVMTVRQSYQVHRHLPQLLNAIVSPELTSHEIYHDEKMSCIHTLQKPVTVNFADTPLTDVAEYLSGVVDALIFLDAFAIEEAGLLTDEPINLVMSGKSLETTFQLILSDFGLTTEIRSGELFITTIEVANEHLHSVVYDVRKISAPSQLFESIPALTSGQWIERDGRGGEMALTENGLLVVRQTGAAHREIAILLNTFILKGANQPTHQIQRHLETRLYRMPAETADDLLTVLPATIYPETWQANGKADSNDNALAVGTIRKVSVGQRVIELPLTKEIHSVRLKRVSYVTDMPICPRPDPEKLAPAPPTKPVVVSESVLIIKQTAAVHNKIGTFLVSLGLCQSALGQKPGQDGKGDFCGSTGRGSSYDCY